MNTSLTAYGLTVVLMSAATLASVVSSPPGKTSLITEAPSRVVSVPSHTPTWQELGELASWVGADSYGLFADRGTVTVSSGYVVGLGALEGWVFQEGDAIPDGPVWNPSGVDVVVETRRSFDRFLLEAAIPANGVIHVGWLARDGTPRDGAGFAGRDGGVPPGCPQTVSVACVSGYFACCFLTEGGCPRALCIRNGEVPPSPCSAGGEGASTCTLTVQ